MDLIPTKLEFMSAVIHFVTSFEEAKTYIGELLAGRGPGDCPPNHVGSHDYSKHSRCIFFGRGYTEEQVREIYSLHRGKGVDGPVAWIAGDPAVGPPPNPGPGGYGPEFAEKAAESVKQALSKWINNGAQSEEIIWY
uniref:Uncharacterized protein n=1 Tax=Bionectria ochroleuca TaxID=29856 RepID=A0A8H7N2K0_BIOOC